MNITLLLVGLTIGTLGKVLLGITVILVHNRVYKEHSIDMAVLKELKRERWIGIAGIVLMIVGYVLEVVFYNSSLLA